MKPDADIYADVAQIYTRLVESDCAAAVLHHIYATAGSQAAWRAALVIQVLKIEAQQNHYFPNLSSYADLFEYFPEVMGVLKQAIADALPAWRIQDVPVQLFGSSSNRSYS
ncbi:MAG: hypothetical protein ABI700_04320 [Chloroflexota bacterium]